MRTVSVLALAFFAGASALTLGPSTASSQTFLFRVCNESNVTAAVAISTHVDVDDQRYAVQGWWAVEPGDCDNIGHFPKGYIYYYAEQRNSGRRYWGGDDLMLCVRYPGPWRRINGPGYSCRSDEKLKGFVQNFIEPDTGTFTWRLKGR